MRRSRAAGGCRPLPRSLGPSPAWALRRPHYSPLTAIGVTTTYASWAARCGGRSAPFRALQPEKEREHSASDEIDYWGLAGVAIGLGCLEYVLDRGERLDWF